MQRVYISSTHDPEAQQVPVRIAIALAAFALPAPGCASCVACHRHMHGMGSQHRAVDLGQASRKK